MGPGEPVSRSSGAPPLLVPSWGPLGPSWGPWAVSGSSWAVLGPSCRPLGPSRGCIRGLAGRPGASGS
eukprot:3240734-Pyramimonas_sp.AAC.1